MAQIGILGLTLILINLVVSYIGFSKPIFFSRYKFDVEKIKVNKEYYRFITSGFLHGDWPHVIFNMLSLYFFSGIIEDKLGEFYFCLIYFISLLAGNALSYYINRLKNDYTAVGASGAVCGVIFASIALFPSLEIYFFIIPIPSWLYGVLYIGYTIYGVISKKGNIGHEAHLGGALGGMILALIIQPSALMENYITILLITIPVFIFLYLIIAKPHVLMTGNFFSRSSTNQKYYTIDDKYNEERFNRQKEIDAILDKISSKGIDSLSKKEKELLNQFSK